MNNIHLSAFFILAFSILISCDSDKEKVYGCDSNSECYNDRVCRDGFCQENFAGDATLIEDIFPTDTNPYDEVSSDLDILIADAEVDSHENDTDDFVCPKACTAGCEDQKCYIDGDGQNSTIQCPDDIECIVQCNVLGDCFSRVICGNDKCTVLCKGPSTCSSGIDCGDSPECNIQCTGRVSCYSPIRCRDSACTIECGRLDTHDSACGLGIDCGTNSCEVLCANDSTCVESFEFCYGEDCNGAYTCNQADYCRCSGPGCWPTPD